jgi:hypothetical protein
MAAMNLLESKGGVWSSRPVERSFAVRQIVAFEAKIAGWRAVIEQASLNRWFASESYVLVPKLPTNREAAIREATACGVGIWLASEARPILQAPVAGQDQPVSFASWVLNEWVWRNTENLKGRRRG